MNSFFGKSSGFYSTMPLRRRSVWEAADSGILLWRESFVYFIPFFAIPLWICACGLFLLPGSLGYFSYLIIWWLKPLFDRTVLHVVSSRFFGTDGSPQKQALHYRLSRTMTCGLAGDLLWRRFSPYRSSRMPIRVLERANGQQYRSRKKALVPGGINFCSFISISCFIAEGLLLLGEVVFVMMFSRMFFPSALEYFQDAKRTTGILIFIAYCLNFFLLESLYVCMGFGLYINSRVEVEGWDLQLLFQKFAGSGETSPNQPSGDESPELPGSSSGIHAPSPAIKIILLICLFFGFFPGSLAQSLYAGEEALLSESAYISPAESTEEIPAYFPEDFPSAGREALLNLEDILASPDFGSEKDGWAIRFKQSEKDVPEPDYNAVPWMEVLRKIFGYMLRLFIFCAIAVFLVFLGYWVLRNHKNIFNRKRLHSGSEGYANPLFSAESPESLFARSEDLHRQGRLRDAWAACFSGYLRAYTHYCSVSFKPDATEYDCLDIVRASLPCEAEGFGSLVKNWIFFEYGGRLPSGGAYGDALAYGRSIGASAGTNAGMNASVLNSASGEGGNEP